MHQMKSPVILIQRRPRRAAKDKVYNERNNSSSSSSQRAAPKSRKRVMASASESEGSDYEASAAAPEEEESASDAEPTDDDDDDEEDEDEDYGENKKKSKKRATTSRKPRSSRSGKKVTAGRKAAAVPKKRQKPSTVSGNRVIHRVNQVMPVLPLRQVQHKQDTAHLSPYALARERLHVSAVPDSLPCREDEFVNIMGYIESAIQEATGTCVYISGVPGTGKTATVLEVIRYLQHQAEQKEIADFDFVEINGMKLTDPNQAYSILWECIERSSNANHDGKRKRYTPAHALQMLEAKFSKQSNDQRTT